MFGLGPVLPGTEPVWRVRHHHPVALRALFFLVAAVAEVPLDGDAHFHNPAPWRPYFVADIPFMAGQTIRLCDAVVVAFKAGIHRRFALGLDFPGMGDRVVAIDAARTLIQKILMSDLYRIAAYRAVANLIVAAQAGAVIDVGPFLAYGVCGRVYPEPPRIIDLLQDGTGDAGRLMALQAPYAFMGRFSKGVGLFLFAMAVSAKIRFTRMIAQGKQQ